MTDSEFDLYLEYFRRLTHDVRQPDLVILRGDEQTSMERIRTRGPQGRGGYQPRVSCWLEGTYDTFEGVARHKYDLNLLTIDLAL